jgi:hypothetical protein
VDHALNLCLHSRQFVDNEFWLRTPVVLSLPGLISLLSGLFLLATSSFAYLPSYEHFSSACPSHVLDLLERNSHFWVMIHSWFLIATSCSVLFLFAAAFIVKLTAVLAYAICPLKYLAFQKWNSRCKRPRREKEGLGG